LLCGRAKNLMPQTHGGWLLLRFLRRRWFRRYLAHFGHRAIVAV